MLDRCRSKRSKINRSSGASHAKRPELQGAVVHVTMKLRPGLPSLRTPRAYRRIERAIRQASDRHGVRMVEFSVMSNHLHFIVEPGSRRDLSRGMQGLAIRLAKALNAHWRRHGKVFLERYFARALTKVTQVRRLFRYVLNNARKHGVPIPKGQVDPYSSARWFPGWAESIKRPNRSSLVAMPECFETAHWRMGGPLCVDEVPGPVHFLPAR